MSEEAKPKLPIEDGGFAFPKPDRDCANGAVQWGADGMTLRDWFAGQAVAGLLADHTSVCNTATYAAVAYEVADAMLVARKKGGAL